MQCMASSLQGACVGAMGSAIVSPHNQGDESEAMWYYPKAFVVEKLNHKGARFVRCTKKNLNGCNLQGRC